ncbi:hypothetical protein Lalb_Chr22g0358341 [Lupinus albus]|uniref:Uncharacterized protein n=1 Tax=Lupinus albus TaxID=3870 RepID=A0A6A4NH18_LUPAL|nr:hypothetical protein Lalb_Chr22g0358341 [Lupinus albus]
MIVNVQRSWGSSFLFLRFHLPLPLFSPSFEMGNTSLQIGNYFPLSRLIANQFLFCCLCFSVFFYFLSNLY